MLPAAEWQLLAAGVEQRHRALNAFLADAYRAAGRRRGDVDRDPEVVRAGVLPEWAVAHSPGRDPDAVGQAWPGQPRATVAAADVVRTADGGWVVTADHLRAPAGLGYALEDRLATVRAAVPGLFARRGAPRDPGDAVALLRAGPGRRRRRRRAPAPPQIAVLTAGESDTAWFEHAVLAEALGVPLVRAADLWPRADGGVEVAVDGERRPGRRPLPAVRRRRPGRLPDPRRPAAGRRCSTEAVRAGRLGLANVPGNGRRRRRRRPSPGCRR